MRIWIAAAFVFAVAVPCVARAADDDTVRGFLAVCNAGDQACLIDIASSLQKAIQVGDSCPNPNLEAGDIANVLIPKLADAVAKSAVLADRGTDATVIPMLKTLYPCPPPDDDN